MSAANTPASPSRQSLHSEAPTYHTVDPNDDPQETNPPFPAGEAQRRRDLEAQVHQRMGGPGNRPGKLRKFGRWLKHRPCWTMIFLCLFVMTLILVPVLIDRNVGQSEQT